MTYDYMVELHINRDGMVTGLLCHRNWRWRWDCRESRGEGWHENTPAFCFERCFAPGVWISGCARLNVCTKLLTVSFVYMLEQEQHLQENFHVHPAWLTCLCQIQQCVLKIDVACCHSADSCRTCHSLFAEPLVYTDLSLSLRLLKYKHYAIWTLYLS